MNISTSALDSLLNHADVTAGSAGGGLMGLFNRAAQQVQQGAGNAEGAGQGGVEASVDPPCEGGESEESVTIQFQWIDRRVCVGDANLVLGDHGLALPMR
jgi:hypothetical protein